MILEEAKQLAEKLIKKYQVMGFSFEFDSAKERFGYCKDSEQKLGLSAPLTLLNNEVIVRDVILHEIAHALTPGCGHNEIWKRVCRAIGGSGETYYDRNLVIKPLFLWTATCPSCTSEHQRNRRNKNLHCSKCYNKTHRLSKETRFKWKKNK